MNFSVFQLIVCQNFYWGGRPPKYVIATALQQFFFKLYILVQELRSREEELQRVSMQQRLQEEALRRREHELAEREVQLVERELNVMILQQVIGKPTPKKRCGKFRKSRLKLLKAGGCKSITALSGIICGLISEVLY